MQPEQRIASRNGVWSDKRPLRVAFCWTNVSGYMASCWRALAARPGIDLWVGLSKLTSAANADFQESKLLSGVDHTFFDPNRFEEELTPRVVDFRPDVVVLAGWHNPVFRNMPSVDRLADCKFVMTMDTPWVGTTRQLLGRFAYRKYFSRISRVVVAAERTWQLARWLGFRERQLMRAMYSIDFDHFAPILEQRKRLEGGWPRQFLFMGRYAEEKAIDVLVEAHARYRLAHDNPWTLACCGRGPMGELLTARPNVVDHGFVQPENAPTYLLNSGCFVLPSRYEPWGAVLAEAAAAGLPIICSEACGGGLDLVQHLYNGFRVATNDPEHLAQAMSHIHLQHEQLPLLGERSQQLARPYGSAAWAERWEAMLCDLVGTAA